ncbi:hypothetical protein K440DRAFT_630675 [Wilcoxina mikolae CBS 423.85]|nr:hypothetical protein K440DRAFT_630675 [Wilcoxina mikolae CBS 423.85]
MPPKTPRTIISATTIVPGSSQIRLADLNTGVKSVRSKRTTTPITATKKTNSRSKLKSKSHTTTPSVKQATLSGFGFAAKPKVPAAQEVGGDRKRRRIISGGAAGSQDNPITIEDEAEAERDEVVIRETQFAGLTQSPGWESDSDLDLDLVEIVRRKSGGDAGKMTPRFSPAKRKKKKKNEGMAPRFSPTAHRKAISTQEEKEWDVMATSGIFGEREKSSDLMPPPPVTPKRPRAPLQLPEEIPNSQSPAPSPLKTQLTQTQQSPARRIGGSKITSPLRVWQSRSPLKTRVGGIAPPVGWTRTRMIVKSSQWWENEDTESEGEGEVRKDVANDRTKPPLQSQVAGTQDGNGTDSSPLSSLHLTPQKSKSPRLSERENREDDMETTTDDDDSTAPLHSPTQPLSDSALQGSPRQRAQEVDINIPPDHMEPASPALKELQGTTQPISSSQHSPAGEVQRNGDIDMDIASVSLEPTPPLSTTHEEAQALSQFSTPRKSQSQREENYGDDIDMDMTFDLGTPCKRQTTPPLSTPPPPACCHQQPRTPSPILPRSQARETLPFDRSPARRSSLATTASLSPSTVREMDPSSLTSFNLSPQQPQTQYSSVQETPPTKPSATTPKLVHVDTQINDASPRPEAEDIVLDTPIKDAPWFNLNFHPDSQMRDPEDRYYDVYDDNDDHDDHDNDATESQDPNIDFHPVKTQQFPHSMFVRSVTDMSSPSPSQSPTNVSQDVGELVLEYDEERMEREAEVGLPPPGGTQEEVSAPTTTGLLTTSQLLPETLMESFPLPPPLTQFSSYPGDETQ